MTEPMPNGKRIIVNLPPKVSGYLDELIARGGSNITTVICDALSLMHHVCRAAEPDSDDADMRTVLITRATEPLTLTVHPRRS